MNLSLKKKLAKIEKRPPRAVIGAQISYEEQIFGRAFDQHIIRRFFSFVWPYRLTTLFALLTVIVFVSTQLSIPLETTERVSLVHRRSSMSISGSNSSTRVCSFRWQGRLIMSWLRPTSRESTFSNSLDASPQTSG